MAISVNFSSALTRRDYLWTEFLDELTKRSGSMQFFEAVDTYTIWFYDGAHEVFVCTIWKGEVPGDLIILYSYSQEQNDLDLDDFETNYKDGSNDSIIRLSMSGVPGQAPAKGLGGFAPAPTNNPYQPSVDEVVALYADGEGQLVTRGSALTDEGSFRDDFVGSTLQTNLTGTVSFTNGSDIVTGIGTLFTTELNRDNYIKLGSDNDTHWAQVERITSDTVLKLVDNYTGTTDADAAEKTRWIEYGFGGVAGTVSVGSSVATLATGTNSTGGIIIYNFADFCPIIGNWTCSVSQRIANQTSFIGFRDDISDPEMYCDVVFDGTSNTVVKFRSAWNGDEQLTTVTLPVGLTTASSLTYKIDMSPHYCALLINSVLVAKHEKHIPDMYAEMIMCLGTYNTGATSSTNLVVDTVFFSNQNQLQVSSTFVDPIPVFTREDQYSIYGSLSTSSTSADQVILSYTVPTGKVLYIIGYRVESSGTLNGNPVKIGRNTVTNEPAAPGTVDSVIFRAFVLNAGESTGDVDFGGNPRKLGIGGDVVKITVTPSGLLSSTWRASMDFVLR